MYLFILFLYCWHSELDLWFNVDKLLTIFDVMPHRHQLRLDTSLYLRKGFLSGASVHSTSLCGWLRRQWLFNWWRRYISGARVELCYRTEERRGGYLAHRSTRWGGGWQWSSGRFVGVCRIVRSCCVLMVLAVVCSGWLLLRRLIGGIGRSRTAWCGTRTDHLLADRSQGDVGDKRYERYNRCFLEEHCSDVYSLIWRAHLAPARCWLCSYHFEPATWTKLTGIS